MVSFVITKTCSLRCYPCYLNRFLAALQRRHTLISWARKQTLHGEALANLLQLNGLVKEGPIHHLNLVRQEMTLKKKVMAFCERVATQNGSN